MDPQTFDNFVLKTYNRYPLTLVKGLGMRVWDKNGTEYLDFFPGWGAGNLGHCHPAVVAALQRQAAEILHVPNVYYNESQGELARLIIENSFDGRVFFGNSGAEANEGAIKLARKRHFAKKTIITLKNSFHGRTIATVTATGQPAYQACFDPLPGGFVYCEVNNVDMLREMMNEEVAAVMFEPVLGEGGVVPISSAFMRTARKLCDQHDALLILDEVQTGIGRTGRLFAFQNYDIVPDILTLAKSLGGGVPIGAFVVRSPYCDVLQPGDHGSTFGGNPLVCAAGAAVMRTVLRDRLCEHADEMGAYLRKKLQILQQKHAVITDVRGLGLMLGMELDRPGEEIVDRCREQKVLINCTHKTVLRLMPALTVTPAEIDRAMTAIDSALSML